MTDTTSTPHAPAPPRPPHEAALFRWIRGLGVVRGNRWVGGVCGGMAARMGIDPLIVRGMFVVAALIGFPAVAIYLVCWMLLPDMRGAIPLQQLARKPVGPVVITLSAVLLVLIGLGVLSSWLRGGGSSWWLLGGWWWSMLGLDSLGGFFSAVLTLALVVAVIVLAVRWSLHYSSSARPVAPDAADAPAPADVSGTSGVWGGPDAGSVSVAPGLDETDPASPLSSGASPADAASPEEVAHWRVRQEEWRTQYDTWRRQQADADAAAKEQIRREREEQGRAFALAAQQRAEERRRTKPRMSALSVLGVLGAALVAGAVTALTTAHLGVTIASGAALLVAAIVCATGMLVAGLLRRRSGFMAFVASTLLAAGLIVGYFGVVVPDGVGTSYTTGSTQTHRQAFGSTIVTVVPTVPGRPESAVTIDKYAGTTYVYVVPGASVSVDARLGDGSVTIESTPAAGGDTKYTDVTPTSRTEAGDRFTWTGPTVNGAAASASPAQVRIDQDHGSVIIEVTEQSK